MNRVGVCASAFMLLGGYGCGGWWGLTAALGFIMFLGAAIWELREMLATIERKCGVK